jgi:hypothetical protein
VSEGRGRPEGGQKKGDAGLLFFIYICSFSTSWKLCFAVFIFLARYFICSSPIFFSHTRLPHYSSPSTPSLPSTGRYPKTADISKARAIITGVDRKMNSHVDGVGEELLQAAEGGDFPECVGLVEELIAIAKGGRLLPRNFVVSSCTLFFHASMVLFLHLG